MSQFLFRILLQISGYGFIAGCSPWSAYAQPSEPPLACGDCGNYYSRLSRSISQSIRLDGLGLHPPPPLLVEHENIIADAILNDRIEEIQNNRRAPLSLNRLPKEIRELPRSLLLLAAYFQPDQKDAMVLVPILRKALSDQLSGTRALAATGLGKIGRQADKAVPDLTQALADSNQIVRLHAARALWQVTGSTTLALPVLVEVLTNNTPDTSDLAAMFIGELGPAAAGAVSVLSRAATSKHPYVRCQAIYALGQIGVGATRSLPVLRKAAKDPNNDEQVLVQRIVRSHNEVKIVHEKQSIRHFATNSIRIVQGN